MKDKNKIFRLSQRQQDRLSTMAKINQESESETLRRLIDDAWERDYKHQLSVPEFEDQETES